MFDPEEELIACGSYSVPAAGSAYLSIDPVPTAVDFALIATSGVCSSTNNAGTVTAASLVPGLYASTNTLNLNTNTGTYFGTQSSFQNASLPATELTGLTSLCAFVEVNGAGGSFGFHAGTAPGTIIAPPPAGAPFQLRYVSHLDIGDSAIDISNDGQSQAATYNVGTSGGTNLCVGVYTFDANEELQSCCACLITPNGLASLSAQAINATSLTGENATSLVVKLLAWSTTAGASSTAPPGTPAPPTSSACNPATPGVFAPGMHAWGTTLHALPSGGPSTYTVTETEFSPALLSAAEFANITQSCEFSQINGSGTSGQCKGCASGGQ